MKTALIMVVATVFLFSTAAVMAQKDGTTTYTRPVPCLLPTGDCVMQMGEACDKAGGKKLEGCADCKDCKDKGKIKK